MAEKTDLAVTQVTQIRLQIFIANEIMPSFRFKRTGVNQNYLAPEQTTRFFAEPAIE